MLAISNLQQNRSAKTSKHPDWNPKDTHTNPEAKKERQKRENTVPQLEAQTPLKIEQNETMGIEQLYENWKQLCENRIKRSKNLWHTWKEIGIGAQIWRGETTADSSVVWKGRELRG